MLCYLDPRSKDLDPKVKGKKADIYDVVSSPTALSFFISLNTGTIKF